MNKNTLSIMALIAGGLFAFSAIINLISCIQVMSWFVHAIIIFTLLLSLAYGFIGVTCLLRQKNMLMLISIMVTVFINFILMIFVLSYGTNVGYYLFSLLGFVALMLIAMASFLPGMVKNRGLFGKLWFVPAVLQLISFIFVIAGAGILTDAWTVISGLTIVAGSACMALWLAAPARLFDFGQAAPAQRPYQQQPYHQSAPAAPVASAAPAGAPANNDPIINQIKSYKDLLDNGVITEEEFEAKKRQLMGL